MRLLLVEDEEKTSSYINRALSELGFTVDVAANGTDGLYLALEYEYDAIVLDVMLPGMDGYGVLEGSGLQTNPRVDAICSRFCG